MKSKVPIQPDIMRAVTAACYWGFPAGFGTPGTARHGCGSLAIWSHVMSLPESCRFKRWIRNRNTGKLSHTKLDCNTWTCPDCSLKLKDIWIAHVASVFMCEYAIWRFCIHDSGWSAASARIRRSGGSYVKIRSPAGMVVYSNIHIHDLNMVSPHDSIASATVDIKSITRNQRSISTSRAWKFPESPEKTYAMASTEEVELHRSTKRLVRHPRTITPKERFSVFKRDGYRCRICGLSADDEGVVLNLDHIVPVIKGGRSNLENLWTLCFKCNAGKSDEML